MLCTIICRTRTLKTQFSKLTQLTRFRRSIVDIGTPIDLNFLLLQSRRKGAPKKRVKGDLEDLKQELDIDHHKISVEELYQRFSTHPETVSETKLS